MITLPPREAYRLWAPSYEGETAVSFLEDRLVERYAPSPAGLGLLDVGCGTGRRLRRAGSALAVGLDLTPEMLSAGAFAGPRLAADARAIPLAAGVFDLVWCRLVAGHLRDAAPLYAELARVCRPGGSVVVTDFHPDAVAAGHRRTFRDAAGAVHEVEHHVHSPEDHRASATAAGLHLRTERAGRVGPLLRPFYERADRLAAYEEQEGLAIVLALVFRRAG